MPSSPVPGASPEYTRAFRLRIAVVGALYFVMLGVMICTFVFGLFLPDLAAPLPGRRAQVRSEFGTLLCYAHPIVVAGTGMAIHSLIGAWPSPRLLPAGTTPEEVRAAHGLLRTGTSGTDPRSVLVAGEMAKLFLKNPFAAFVGPLTAVLAGAVLFATLLVLPFMAGAILAGDPAHAMMLAGFPLLLFFLVGFNLRSWYWIRKARGFRAGYGTVA